jgi:hypothetical protein
VSAAARPPAPEPLPPAWERLERAAYGTADALLHWRRRALESEAEVVRLRRVLEEVTGGDPATSGEGGGGEVRRLRAENALLVSRAAEARRRISTILARLAALESRR